MRTITALYDSREHAEAAREQLTAIGVQPMSVQITSSDGGGANSSAANPGEARGLLQSLKDFFMPDDDRQAYGEGVRRGGYLLTAQVEEDRADAVCSLLDESGAIDFDERQQQWRTEGWAGRDEAGPGDIDRAETIPVLEEQLQVGKREVGRGGVRVRSYVRETPIEEQIQLREERVEIERRTVDEPIAGADADELFQERSIELTEHAEEAVVAKEAVIREEIGIRKDVDQRTETVSDTVRDTVVEVDDTRTTVRHRAPAGPMVMARLPPKRRCSGNARPSPPVRTPTTASPWTLKGAASRRPTTNAGNGCGATAGWNDRGTRVVERGSRPGAATSSDVCIVRPEPGHRRPRGNPRDVGCEVTRLG